LDEHGIPLSLYAAGQLLAHEKGPGDVLTRILKEPKDIQELSPAASFLLQDILEGLSSNYPDSVSRTDVDNGLDVIQKHIRRLEHILALQNDYQGLRLTLNQDGQPEKTNPLWLLYGEELWLTSTVEAVSERPFLLIAISADEFLASLRSDKNFTEAFPIDFHFVSENNPEGLSLGPNFQRVKIVYAENQEPTFSTPWSVQPFFYLLTLFLILGVTMFGAYLLWRDVRREVQIAEMRSQFVSSVSHELKTPLTAIRMFAETLRMDRLKDRKCKQNSWIP
jgi:signal transduction histidine kinase